MLVDGGRCNCTINGVVFHPRPNPNPPRWSRARGDSVVELDRSELDQVHDGPVLTWARHPDTGCPVSVSGEWPRPEVHPLSTRDWTPGDPPRGSLPSVRFCHTAVSAARRVMPRPARPSRASSTPRLKRRSLLRSCGGLGFARTRPGPHQLPFERLFDPECGCGAPRSPAAAGERSDARPAPGADAAGPRPDPPRRARRRRGHDPGGQPR